MKRMYTERHNKAGRILLDAIYNARGSDICMADVGSQQRCEDDGAPVGLNHVPAEMLPAGRPRNRGARPVAAHQAARHHALQHAGHSQEDRARHDICIVELKTCQDAADRPADGGATTTRS
jgi:hypothetical protein